MLKYVLLLSTLVSHAVASAIVIRQVNDTGLTPDTPDNLGDPPIIPISQYGPCTPSCDRIIPLLSSNCQNQGETCRNLCTETNIKALDDCNACVAKEGPSVLGDATVQMVANWISTMANTCEYFECSPQCNDNVANIVNQCSGIYYESCRNTCDLKADDCFNCLKASFIDKNHVYLARVTDAMTLQHFWCSNPCGAAGLDWRETARPCWSSGDGCKASACTADGNSKRETFSKCLSTDHEAGGIPGKTRTDLQGDIDRIDALCKDSSESTQGKCETECGGPLRNLFDKCSMSAAKCQETCSSDSIKSLETCNSCIQDSSKGYMENDKKEFAQGLEAFKTWCNNNADTATPSEPPNMPDPSKNNNNSNNNNSNNNNSNNNNNPNNPNGGSPNGGSSNGGSSNGGSSNGGSSSGTGSGSGNGNTGSSSRNGAAAISSPWLDVVAGMAVAVLVSLA